MSTKVRTTIIGAMAASALAISAIPAAAIVPHGGHGHGHAAALAIVPHGGHGHGHAAALASVPVKHGPHGPHGGGCLVACQLAA